MRQLDSEGDHERSGYERRRLDDSIARASGIDHVKRLRWIDWIDLGRSFGEHLGKMLTKFCVWRNLCCVPYSSEGFSHGRIPLAQVMLSMFGALG